MLDRTSLTPAEFEIGTTLEWEDWKHVVLPRIEAASKLEIPHLPILKPHKGHAVIVGAGPSATRFLPKIHKLIKDPIVTVFSLNGAHDWLIEHEIIPSIHVIFEYDLDKVNTSLGGSPEVDTVYYLASHCSEQLFIDLKANRLVLWHADIPLQEYHEAIEKHFPGEFLISGGYATFFKTLTIAITLGYRNFDLFGVDGSFDTNSHLDGYPTSNVEESIKVWGLDPRSDKLREFTTNGGLAFQANEFIKFCNMYHSDIKLRVHGDSLMRYLHEARYPDQYERT